MSIRAREWAWHESKTEGTKLLLLLAIAEHMRDDPRLGAWPSQERLAAMIRKHVKTVRRLTEQLTERGLLSVSPNGGPAQGKGRRPHRYRFPALVTAAELGDKAVSANSSELGDTQMSGISGARQPELRDIAVSQLGDIWMSSEEREQREQRGARERDPSSSPEVFRDNCPRHRHDANPPACWDCGRTRRRNAQRRQQAHGPWCGICDERTRQLDTEPVTRCPRCHPRAIGAQP